MLRDNERVDVCRVVCVGRDGINSPLYHQNKKSLGVNLVRFSVRIFSLHHNHHHLFLPSSILQAIIFRTVVHTVSLLCCFIGRLKTPKYIHRVQQTYGKLFILQLSVAQLNILLNGLCLTSEDPCSV